jgi:hypothetical protein
MKFVVDNAPHESPRLIVNISEERADKILSLLEYNMNVLNDLPYPELRPFVVMLLLTKEESYSWIKALKKALYEGKPRKAQKENSVDAPNSKEELLESDIADILRIYPDWIEPKLTLIKEQYKTKSGLIDALYNDKDGNYLVVELKRENLLMPLYHRSFGIWDLLESSTMSHLFGE